MTAPNRTPYSSLYGVNDDDITQALTSYLLSQPEIVDVVGKEPGTNRPFIFQDVNLKSPFESTSTNAIVVSYSGDWARGRGSFDSVRMSIELYCDPLRDEQGNAPLAGGKEVRLRMKQIEGLLDVHLNQVGQKEIKMGSLLTIDHTKLGAIAMNRIENTDGTLRGQVFYGISYWRAS